MPFRRAVVIIAATLAALVVTGSVSILELRYEARTEVSGYRLIRQARAAEEVGDLQRAADLYGQSLQQPNLDGAERGLALGNRAKVFELLQQFDKAEADWSARVEIKPLTPTYYRDRGLFFLRRGAYETALADFAAGRNLDRNKASYLLGEAQVFTARGEHRAAVERYTAAIALDPTNSKVRIGRADAESRAGLHAEARDDYDKVIATNEAAPPDKKRKGSEIGPIYLARGHASLQLGDYPRAIADFDQVLATTPRSADALRWRGSAFEQMGDRARALGDYRAALALDPKDDDAAERVIKSVEGR